MNTRKEIIVDDEIVLKELTSEEIEPIFNMLTTQREYFAEWLPFVDYTQKIEDTKAFVESAINSDSPDLTCAIYYKGEFVGLIGYKDTDLHNKKTEIGYWLSKYYQHKGIVTRSCHVLIKYIFDELGMNKIRLKAVVENAKSRRVAERLGFTEEGTDREAELHSGGYVDMAIYGLLRSEWKN